MSLSIRRLRVALVGASLLATSALSATGPVAAQTSPCDLVAPFELSELTGAAIGSGEFAEGACTWTTETPGGHLLTVTLDTLTEPPTVVVATDDPAIDAAAVEAAILALVTDRLEQGIAAPTPFAGGGEDGERPDLCEVFAPEDIEALLGVTVSSYGGGQSCGWMSTEPGRVMPGAVVAFETGDLDGGINGFPDAVADEVAGLPALAYGWETSLVRSAYLTVDLGDGLLTANATSDTDEVDAEAVARTLAEAALAAIGIAADPSPAP